MRRLVVLAVLVLSCGFARAQARAEEPVEPTPRADLAIPEAARPGPGFDVERATQAYLATLPAADRARSDAYFEGGYWLQLWGFLYGLVVVALLLELRLSARLRDLGERATRRSFLQALLYGAAIVVLASVLTFPWSVWVDFVREHRYGLSNLSFGAWLGEQAKGLGVTVLLGAPAIALVHAVIRRRQGRWWIPAAMVATGVVAFASLITPVFLAPIFNQYRPLHPGPVRDAIVSMARANGLAAEDVFWFDASKQTSRISANVSGLFGTTRVSLNDNLLRETSLPEIESVLAHELGHAVLHHVWIFLIEMGLVLAFGFALVERLQGGALRWRGARWGVRGPGDLAGLPLVFALLSTWFFAATPVTNSIVRVHESEADLFGLNAAREPHAFATISMRLASYRKLAPTPLEEAIFYDHPSGATRVRMSMTWLREHPEAGVGGLRSAP